MEEVVPVSQNTVVVKELHPGTSYAVTVTAENEVGQGEPSNTNYFVTGEEGKVKNQNVIRLKFTRELLTIRF